MFRRMELNLCKRVFMLVVEMAAWVAVCWSDESTSMEFEFVFLNSTTVYNTYLYTILSDWLYKCVMYLPTYKYNICIGILYSKIEINPILIDTVMNT